MNLSRVLVVNWSWLVLSLHTFVIFSEMYENDNEMCFKCVMIIIYMFYYLKWFNIFQICFENVAAEHKLALK